MRKVVMYCDRCKKEFENWNHKKHEMYGVVEFVYEDGDPYYLDEHKDLCESCYTELENWWNFTPQTERKKGHWIEYPHEAGANWEYSLYECSECHGWSNDDSSYCPKCGSYNGGAVLEEIQNNETTDESLEQKILQLEEENKKLKQEVKTLYDEAAEAHELGVEQI